MRVFRQPENLRLPLYYEMKIVFIVWLTLPKYQGAAVIYGRLIHPYFCRFEDDIDGHLQDVQLKASRHIRSLTTTVATEVVRAVTRQGTSMKEQLLAQAIRLTAAEQAEPEVPPRRRRLSASGSRAAALRDEVDAGAGPSDAGDASGSSSGADDPMDADGAAAEEEMLVAFRTLLRAGIHVPVRQEGEAAACSRRIRLEPGSACTLLVTSARSNASERPVQYHVFSVERPKKGRADPLQLHTQFGRLELHLTPQEGETLYEGFRMMTSDDTE
ncbi:unnamed protein product [Phaeothamnion confervicola]